MFNPLIAPAAQQLTEIVVRPNPNREADYQRFRELFLDNSTLSHQCRILNPDGERVNYDPQQNVLTASVPHVLVVGNPALGYRLTFYQLDFQAEFANQNADLILLTQVVFKDLPGSARQQKRWVTNRQKAYLGSYQHFLRSIYINRVAAEGFRVQKLRRVPNPRRLAADDALRQRQYQGNTGTLPNSLLKALPAALRRISNASAAARGRSGSHWGAGAAASGTERGLLGLRKDWRAAATRLPATDRLDLRARQDRAVT